MPTYRHGRHEHGQNFLHDRATRERVVELVRSTTGPIVEIGAGDGALTLPLARLGRPVTAVEIDTQLVRRLGGRLTREGLDGVRVRNQDFLRYQLPTRQHVLVGNLPFHQTTAILRRILRAPGWTEAVLLVQWEVARRRAGVGGSTLMTVQWSPWFGFELGARVPARAFTPAPGVDGGLLTISRRRQPLLAPAQRDEFQELAHRIFTGRGRGLVEIATRAGLFDTGRSARRWATRADVPQRALPRELSIRQWIDLFESTRTR